MKKIFYNSWIARTFLLAKYDTITLAAWVCTKYNSKNDMPQCKRNHECTHARQWIEMFIGSWVFIWAAQVLYNISEWWYLFSFFSFYIWYVVEWLIKLCFYGSKAYRNISFEREAYSNQNNETYLENSGYFEWVKYLFS